MKKKIEVVSKTEQDIPEYHLENGSEKTRERKHHIPKGLYLSLIHISEPTRH